MFHVLRLRCIILGVALLACCATAAHASPQDLSELSCKSYLIFDLQSERIVAQGNPERSQPIASITKLMTSILAAERLRFDGRYILTAEEQKVFHVETMRGQKMLEMMLIPSNNKMCSVVARIISGSDEAFVKEMNAKAQQLGMYNTRFATPSGLPREGQYSTMEDVLALTRVALTYPRIRDAMTRETVDLNGEVYAGTLRELYGRHPGLIGGKTGYTNAAGRCLTLWYRSSGRDYIVITLCSKGSKSSFRDVEILLSHFDLWDGEVGAWE